MLREEYKSGMTACELATKYRLYCAAVMRRHCATGMKMRLQGLTAGQARIAVTL
jgi:hypothetical protein